MHYLIYKITNRIDNKFYIGKHKTKDKNDDYFGSGLLLERAVEKHGKENFIKELLFELSTETEMNQKEVDIVDEDFIARPDTYNIKLGGCGGFDHINKNGFTNYGKPFELFSRAGKSRARYFWNRYNTDPEFKEAMAEKRKNNTNLQKFFESGNSFKGRTHSKKSIEKMRLSAKGKHSGKKNGSFGTHWITNGIENCRVNKLIPIVSGWRKGRV